MDFLRKDSWGHGKIAGIAGDTAARRGKEFGKKWEIERQDFKVELTNSLTAIASA
jgi:hypothetical protein